MKISHIAEEITRIRDNTYLRFPISYEAEEPDSLQLVIKYLRPCAFECLKRLSINRIRVENSYSIDDKWFSSRTYTEDNTLDFYADRNVVNGISKMRRVI